MNIKEINILPPDEVQKRMDEAREKEPIISYLNIV
jgi:hypothetical protein